MVNGRKKIIFTLNGLMFGGVARNTVNLANEMAGDGHDITIAVLRLNRDLISEIDARVQVRFFKSTLIRSFIPFAFFLRYEKPDLLISAKDHVNIFSILAHKLSFISGKCIVTIRTTLSEQMKHRPTKDFQRTMFLARYIYPLANTIVAVSKGTARDAEKFLNLPLGTIETIYNPAAKPSAFMKTYPLPDHPFFKIKEKSIETPIILACGRYAQQKNFECLICAFTEVLKKANAHLIILGDGGKRKKLETLIQASNIEEFISLQPNIAEPERYMAHSNLFVLSSLWEGFANVIVEALSTGCPVLSVDCPHGPAEILENGKYGRLVDNDSPIALAEAILQELEKPNPSMSPQKLKERAQDFTPSVIASQYLQLLNSSISH